MRLPRFAVLWSELRLMLAIILIKCAHDMIPTNDARTKPIKKLLIEALLGGWEA